MYVTYKASDWLIGTSPTLVVSDGMYERHACTDGERQNAAPMICTSITRTDSER